MLFAGIVTLLSQLRIANLLLTTAEQLLLDMVQRGALHGQ